MNKGGLVVKKMRPMGWFAILYSCFFVLMLFSISTAAFWTSITGFINMKDWNYGLIYILFFLIAIVMAIGGISCIISMSRCSIIFESNKIIVAGFKHGPTILYKEIYDIRILCACVDLRGKTPKRTPGIVNVPRPVLYYEVLLIDGSSKLIPLEVLSIRQRKHVLDVINENTGKSFSYEELLYLDRSPFSRKKNNVKSPGKIIGSEYPSWIKESMIDSTKSIYQNATDILNQKYGCNNWCKGPTTEYGQIVKWIENHMK